MNKRIAYILVAAGLLLSAAVPTVTTYAVPSAEEVQAQSDVDAAKAQVQAADDKIQGIMIEIQKLDQQICDQEIKKQETATNIQNTENDIKKTEEDIKAKQAEVDETQKTFEARMAALYKRGGENIVEILFDSDSLGEMIAKIEGAKKIAEHDKQLLAELEEQKQELKDKSDELETKKQELVELQKQQQAAIDEMNVQKAKQQPLLDQAQAEKAQLDALLSATEGVFKSIQDERLAVEAAARAAAEAAAQAARDNQGGFVPSRGSGNGQSIVSTADNYRGIYYVWGGTTPAGFDCSGFTQYVYRQCGYSIGRTTYNQINDGSYVSPDINSLQPGDLVFFGPASAPYHVGIYAGGGQYIHSPTEGEPIKYSSLYGKYDFSAARRIVG